MYKLAVFDLDGTILYTIEQLAVSLNEALSMSGLQRLDTELVRSRVGNGARKLIERCLPDSDEKTRELVLDNYRRYYNEHCIDNTYPYDGIVDLFKTLKEHGVKIAVVTNKSDPPSIKLIDHFFPGLVDIVRGHGEGIPHKPDPVLVNEVMEALKAGPEDTVCIGDSDVDILMSVYSKTSFVGVTWGYRSKDFLIRNGATKLADNCNELKDYLLN